MKGLLGDLRRAADWHRRLLAAALAAGSVALAIEAAEPAEPPTTAVLAAAHDLRGGTQLSADAIAQVRLPAAAVPAGVTQTESDLIGRMLTGPVRAGEPITDVRLVGPSLVEQWGPGLVATPVRIADPEVALLIEPGDRIDVLAANVNPLTTSPISEGADAAEIVARNVPVLAVPEPAEQAGLTDGVLVLVATTPLTARAIAGAALTSRLSLTIRASERP